MRGSHHAAISSACSLVCAAAKRQPVEPVKATSPARIEVALVVRPSVALAQASIEALGLTTKATSIRAGLVAAAGRAGAGDKPGADRGCLGGQTERFDRGLRERNLVVRHAGEEQVLPD